MGILSVAAWTAVTISIAFLVIKATLGLRVTPEEELRGLDVTEHGMPSSYADFMPAGDMFYSRGTSAEMLKGEVPIDKAVEVVKVTGREPVIPPTATAPVRSAQAKDSDAPKITKISIVCQQSKFEDLKIAMNNIGVSGITVTQVLGCGTQKGAPEYYRGVPMDIQLLPKTQVEMVISSVPVMDVINATRKALYTGHIGDGKIFVYDVEDVVTVSYTHLRAHET